MFFLDAGAPGFVLAMIIRCATEGKRCPSNDDIRSALKTAGLKIMGPEGELWTTWLAKRGKIATEVWPKNWRVVEICSGPDKGLKTAPTPFPGKPYLRIDQDGTRRINS